MRFEYYDQKEFVKSLSKLPPDDQAKILRRIAWIEKVGLSVSCSKKWVRKLELNLYEIRVYIDHGISRSFFFHYVGDQYIITHNFIKKSQKTPRMQIRKANQRRKRYDANRKND